ncbi:plasma membrane calcium [Neocucurbitaria cava]|uniref:Plasma membrane calcium n=1 Tax=Neocucurbitaria cava TaxID=798079 RepID=A0A9W8XYB3_9PLEO|nr:plasma membrane calcium [Neocucurbitaria cava]
MWKMIIGQALYQISATFTLHFAGPRFLPSYPEAEMRSLIFNMFVWLQIFNQYNNRRLDNRLNIFVGIHRNWYFIGLNVVMVGRPFVVAYRPCARLAGRVVEKLRSKRWKSENERSEVASDGSGSDVGRGKSPVQTIRVTGDVEKGLL